MHRSGAVHPKLPPSPQSKNVYSRLICMAAIIKIKLENHCESAMKYYDRQCQTLNAG